MFAFRERSNDSVDSWVCYFPISMGGSLDNHFFTSVQLLHKLSIRGVNGPEKLLKVIKVSCILYFFLSLMPSLTPSDPQS